MKVRKEKMNYAQRRKTNSEGSDNDPIKINDDVAPKDIHVQRTKKGNQMAQVEQARLGHGDEYAFKHEQTLVKSTSHQRTRYVHKDTEQPDVKSQPPGVMGAADNTHGYSSTAREVNKNRRVGV